LNAIRTAYPNRMMLRIYIVMGLAPRKPASGFDARRKKCPLLNENIAFAFKM
jgi:hypothetical protein